ncbi:phytoene desaturase family protein [Streptomyces sp. NBC_00872]|uniref:phytoene desaturase family protein n=1 Tax=Streptomyces sp. NBC_00872 TaxID=2903686 RepID=UPI003870CAC2|nr:NAD(P)/FAD-dependent oxidoreductase [Streptomyces sp. NBC_00872]
MNDFCTTADVVLVGAGHNALVAAAYLLRAGRSVCLIDRMEQPGGWVRTDELGAPGYLHDRWSALHPALVGGPVWAELGPDLRRHGLDYVVAPLATGSSLPDGRTAIAPVAPEALAAELDRLGESSGWGALFSGVGPYLPTLFGLLGDGLDGPVAQAAFAELSSGSRESAIPFERLLTGDALELVNEHFRTEEMRSLVAPWPLHLGAGPEAPGSALWAAVALATLTVGNPTPVGGSGRLAEALADLVTERGGDIHVGVDVDEILVRDGRAVGVRTTDGATVRASEAVVVSTPPDLLYGRLLRNAPGIPAGIRGQAGAYRYRRGCFQINLALSARPRFTDSRLDQGGAINLGRGVNALVTSVRQAEAGVLPEHPSVSWHEPTAVDPSRAPAGHAVVRLQVLDVPHSPSGDAAGTSYGAGGWDVATAEAFADRVVAEAESHAPGFADLVVERHITTPADLALHNPNAGPGDHAQGDNSLAQAFTRRPMAAHRGGYRTAVPGLWQIGAATWPGPGVSGGSGRNIAHVLTRDNFAS